MSISILYSIAIDKSTGKGTELGDWAEQNLSESDYNRYLQAQARQDEMYQNEGVRWEYTYKTEFSDTLQSNISVINGFRVFYSSYIPSDDQEWEEFNTMFSQDPNIIFYQKIDE